MKILNSIICIIVTINSGEVWALFNDGIIKHNSFVQHLYKKLFKINYLVRVVIIADYMIHTIIFFILYDT